MSYKVTHCVLANVNLIGGTRVIMQEMENPICISCKKDSQVAGVIQA